LKNVFIFSWYTMKDALQTADQWIALLQDSGSRDTASRRTIVEILLNTPRALEPLEIFEIGRKHQARLGLVTVYRTLEKLEELGLIQRVHQPGGCNKYLRAAQGHQHLLICTMCGKAEFFGGSDITPLMDNIAQLTGFQITEHWLQLFGQCSDCRLKQE
jgi:Fur family ferric uptake transcriptional regulator